MTSGQPPHRPATAEARPPLGELGGYQLLEPVGRGALGEVFRARDTLHGRTVAVKKIPQALMADADRLVQLRDTAMALAGVSHPGVAMLYECGDDDGQTFIAQEFVPGQRLSELIGGRPISVPTAVDIATRIADGLAALHAAKLVHGDLRPDNVVVTPRGHVKLLDAGLYEFTAGGAARRQAAGAGAANPAALRYAAPEQALGQPGDARADLFALGLVLYEMLTGQSPFARSTGEQTVLAILGATPPMPREARAGVPAALDAIVAKAIARPVAARYQTAAEFGDALRGVKALVDDPLDQALAVEEASGPRLWLVLILLAGLGGLATWVWMAYLH